MTVKIEMVSCKKPSAFAITPITVYKIQHFIAYFHIAQFGLGLRYPLKRQRPSLKASYSSAYKILQILRSITKNLSGPVCEYIILSCSSACYSNWYGTPVCLRGINALGIFHHFYKRDTFCDFLFAFPPSPPPPPPSPSPFWKGPTRKGKNLLPRGANSFLLEKAFFRGKAKQLWQSYPSWKYINSLKPRSNTEHPDQRVPLLVWSEKP